MLRSLCASLILQAALSPALFAQAVEREIPGDPVAIDSGLVAGKRLSSGVHAYFGVPFAAPPVRELRWRAPEPIKPWSGVLHANRFAPECIQALRAHDINHYFGEEATSEDCLYLNVWAPSDATSRSRKPVAVWIYGGGFIIGSAAMANYQGEALARKGIVYVSIAYRVGALGFLGHPALTAESPHHSSGNQGLLDQIAALQWVQRNIDKLGGDPGNVTIMGQSAGSMAVSVLQASPLARGLFHRVVGMSGGSFSGEGAGSSRALSSAEQSGTRFQQELKVDSLAAMRNVPADRLLQTQLALPPNSFGPVVDEYLLPATPAEIFSKGAHNDVPTLIGFTHDESFSDLARSSTLSDFQSSVRRMYGDRADALLKLYPAGDDAEARVAAVAAARDSSVALQMRRWARAQSGHGKSPVYAYLFSRVHPYAPGVTFADHDPQTVGAYHTGDVPFWLGTLDSLNMFRTTRNWTTYDRRLAEQMSDALVAFVSSGNPNRNGSSNWPRYRADREQILEFGDNVRVTPWPDRAQLDWFDKQVPTGSAKVSAIAGSGPEPAIGAAPVLEDRYPPRRIAFPEGVSGYPDLTYASLTGFRPLTLDLYRPTDISRPRPLVIYLHGGGWQSGHTRHSGAFENWPGVLASIAARGYVVASVEYRLSREAPFPAAIQDVKAAIRWLRANAATYGIDGRSVVVWGGSAGGQLAALAGTTCGVGALEPPGAAATQRPEPGAVGAKAAEPAMNAAPTVESDCVQGVVAWYGIFDFSALTAQSLGNADAADPDAAPARYLGCALSKCAPSIIAAASAISYVDARDPPVLMIHGVSDHTVPIQQSRAFLAASRARGVSAQLIEIPGADHSFIGATPEATRAASLQALHATVEFIDRVTGPRN